MRLGFFGHGFDKFRIDLLLDKDAAARGADFALIDEDAEQRAVDGRFPIRVGEENVGRLAAELERDALQRVCGLLTMILPTAALPVNAILSTPGCCDQRRSAGFAKAVDDVDHAGRQTHFREPVRKFQRGERRLLGGLQNAGAARGQRRRQLPRGHQQRIVPGDDLPGDADRLLAA